MKNAKRQDFTELTKLLLDYWDVEDDLSNTFKISNMNFEIEEMIIRLAEVYKK